MARPGEAASTEAGDEKSKSPRSRRVSPEASTEPPSGFEPETYALRGLQDRLSQCWTVPPNLVSADQRHAAMIGVTPSPARATPSAHATLTQRRLLRSPRGTFLRRHWLGERLPVRVITLNPIHGFCPHIGGPLERRQRVLLGRLASVKASWGRTNDIPSAAPRPGPIAVRHRWGVIHAPATEVETFLPPPSRPPDYHMGPVGVSIALQCSRLFGRRRASEEPPWGHKWGLAGSALVST